MASFSSFCGISSTAGEGQQLQDHRRCAGIDAAVGQMSRSSDARFKFVGPTIVYAFMQATGMVNDIW
jgi:3-methyladenine DNA glycosylase Tag